MALILTHFSYVSIFSMIFIATFIPSIADVVIPPAYPAPSPHGYIPFTDETNSSFLIIVIGDELLVSTPVSIASGWLKPFILVSKYGNASLIVWETYSGNILSNLN